MKNRFKDALQVQDACNISGVARSFVAVIDDARANPMPPGTNPDMDSAVILFAYKIASLVGVDSITNTLDAAWKDCEVRAAAGDLQTPGQSGG